MTDLSNRRPLKIRDQQLMRRFAAWLSRRSVTPNQISVLSVIFALGGGAALVLAGQSVAIERSICFIAAALFIQLRLLCNLFDGMVAMEGGKQTPAGELFNDVPDRIADPLLIVACGFALPDYPSAMWLAWLGALLAVMTAYIRVLGVSLGLSADFRGPMAKQQRMALITIASVLSALDIFWGYQGMVLWISLIVLVVGSAATALRRLIGAYLRLQQRGAN
ncbi:CDP-alcohol phosphatidyltransferase family protein [Pseudomonas sp. 5Ae-yellow]|uniref:CDP-alcohol phosphatidyltransferase family protein n=1 Tax=Pseudomonas sp. 5Ae-yellow TaxID=2759848 RepID=UPI0015F6D9A4|nr:CDP-alcohol phosphatidyltransferase family protein [Pseudomonas sp. 5Ae-yellow]MBA6418436.1 CDP-alcohol phosphatidyltransferase family protein [Pseudomonas sp. 5Ae-yellow]|tara:strand:- start:397 stop:1059 length:663 start_codon:yes stop_codon:yes gene_type:complete